MKKRPVKRAQTKTCVTCQHWEEVGKHANGLRQGRCHAAPPCMFPIRIPQKQIDPQSGKEISVLVDSLQTSFPITTEQMYCAQHRGKRT